MVSATDKLPAREGQQGVVDAACVELGKAAATSVASVRHMMKLATALAAAADSPR